MRDTSGDEGKGEGGEEDDDDDDVDVWLSNTWCELWKYSSSSS
jgi:hypothetical protein